MVHHPRHLSELTGEEITTLASLLSLPLRLLDAETGTPTDLWLAAQARYAAALPKPLRRPHNWLARLSMTADRHLQQSRPPALEDLVPQCAVLCPAHRGLNPWVVRRAFFLVSREATTGTDALRRYLARPGRYHGPHARNRLGADTAGEVRALVDRLAGVVALWTDPVAVGRMLGGDGAGDGVRLLPRIRSQCEACIVAAVGADAQALCDLRAGLLGRRHKRRKSSGGGSSSSSNSSSSRRRRREPVLLRLVEAWIARFHGGGEELLRESDRLGKVARRVRRAVRDHKRGRGGKSSRGHGHGHGSHGGGGGGSKAGGSHGKQPSTSSSSSHTQARPSASGSSSTIITPSRHHHHHHDHHHHRGGQSDNAARLAVVDDNNPRPQNPSHRSSNANTIDDIIDAYGGGGDDDDDDEELDEADPRTANRLQDTASRWYGAFSDVGEQHPAFRQSAADIQASWAAHAAAESRVARSAVPAPLRLSGDKGTVVTRMPFGDDGGHGETEDFDPAEWTDVSVPTLATRSGLNVGRGRLSPAPAVPKVPSVHRAPRVVSLVGSSADDGDDDDGDEDDDGAASSLYSQDGTAVPHPAASTASRSGSRFVNPRAAPPVPAQHGRRRGMPDDAASVATSRVTLWPGPNSRPQQQRHHHQTTTVPTGSSGSRGHRHRHTPSSSSSSSSSTPRRPAPTSAALSADEFQSGLDRLSLLDADGPARGPAAGTAFGGHIPEGTVLPGESVSVVGGLCPDARARARPPPVPMMGSEGEEEESDESDDEEEGEGGDDDDQALREVIALSRVTAREDEERRRRAGRRGMFSDMALPGEW